MKKLLGTIIATLFALCGISIMAFAVLLMSQISDWVMIVLCVVIFFIGVMAAYSGWRVWRGDEIKEILGDFFISIGR